MKSFLHTSTSHGVLLEEPLIFERSRPNATGAQIPEWDVPHVDASKILGKYARKKAARLPEVSEPEVVRHFTRLSTWNYSVELGIFPLGSCTMKYNPRFNEEVARHPFITDSHPYDPEEWLQGHLQILYELQEDLKAITGLQGACLQPAAGAHGEFAGLQIIAAYHKSKGEKRHIILVPDTSHGTNPASAAFAGFQTKQLPTDADGTLHPETVRAAMSHDVAGLMITNPNTVGVFEKHIQEIANILHEYDALLYVDGANMNAILGLVRPGDFGTDVMHLNLHKTFSTPHGGGGPGAGPICVCEKLIPFLPIPRIVKEGYKYTLRYNEPLSIGRVRAFFGNYAVCVRAWAYIRALGAKGLRQVSEDAILNANYIRKQLEDIFHLPFQSPNLHEVVFNDKNQKDQGLDTTTIAKRLIDYGMHPPTIHFPLLVKAAIMVEPTETEDKTELERFVQAMREIVESSNAMDTSAQEKQLSPVRVFRERIDEAKAARELKLRYTFPENP